MDDGKLSGFYLPNKAEEQGVRFRKAVDSLKL